MRKVAGTLMAVNAVFRCPECESIMLRGEGCDPRYCCVCPFCTARDEYIMCDECDVAVILESLISSQADNPRRSGCA